jgi:hypothetical protein
MATITIPSSVAMKSPLTNKALKNVGLLLIVTLTQPAFAKEEHKPLPYPLNVDAMVNGGCYSEQQIGIGVFNESCSADLECYPINSACYKLKLREKRKK